MHTDRLQDKQQHEHNESIVSQFTKQAVHFARMKEHSNEDEFELIYSLTKVNPDDTVLDVACGPGIVACALARIARHVTGIDLTPAMIEQAKLLQAEKGSSNVTLKVGNASPLQYKDSSFSLVVTRYSFHHFLDPRSVLYEMKRVCTPGGRVAVIDVTPPEGKADAYNHMEKLRDPSHARAMSLAELQGMMEEAGLTELQTGFYKLDIELEKILQATLTRPKDAEEVRRLFAEDLKTGNLGVGSYLKEGKVRFAFPITIIVGRKKSA
jgi:ubiquinone/menaquinone biosynthesis C-methylase UbiE